MIVPWTADAYEPLENNPEGLALIKAIQKDGANVIIELEPAVSNVWFEKSEQKKTEFDQFYIWRSGDIKGTDTNASSPNNWVSSSKILDFILHCLFFPKHSLFV